MGNGTAFGDKTLKKSEKVPKRFNTSPSKIPIFQKNKKVKLLDSKKKNQPKCTHQALIYKKHTNAQLCEFSTMQSCASTQGVINFFQFYWCTLSGNLAALLLIYIVLIFLIFKYTSIAVDEYVAEGIKKVSDWLKFSDSLAAVTLLAFANGAGDVITALVAGDTDGGVDYNIGALYGAGLFVCSMVVAICIF